MALFISQIYIYQYILYKIRGYPIDLVFSMRLSQDTLRVPVATYLASDI